MPNPVRRLHHRTLALINRAIDGLAEGAQGGGDAPGRRDPRAQGARMRFEPLEQRLLMSADLLPGLTTALTGSNPDGAISLVTYADEAGEAQARITLQANGQPSQAFVDTLDTDDFSTPLQPLSPRGSLVFAGGVQGSLAATGDADSLHIELEAGQLFALRFQTTDADSDLRARVEVFDAADRSLGFVEAGQAGDGLSLQQLAGADGATRIEVSATPT
ncbi:MAG: LEPR-XLL domain-containing protein, partial [Aquabacterium sp.]